MVQTKKYCLNCFQIMQADQARCDRCQFVQPSTYNPTYLQPPFRLSQQYIVGRVLGHGGFAVTYLGYDRHLGTRVAIKEYFPAEFATRSPDGQTVLPYAGEKQTLFQLGKEKFIGEARLLATLRNPHIIRIRQFVEACNTAYFIMEYLEGQTLKEYVTAKGGQLTWAETKQLLWPMLDALDEVHLKQCYHRDIKPENIYITREGHPILLDFGAARQQMSGATTNLLAFLTPGFAPAEQYSANGIQGPWTDIYAFAATMYYCLTGQTPPVPQDRALGESELIPPSRQGIAIPPREEEWLLKGLELKWSHRPESIHDWRRSMEKSDVTTTMELKADDLQREMERAFLRSTILPRLMSRFLTPDAEREINDAAGFVGIEGARVTALIEQALLMTGSERREPKPSAPLHQSASTPVDEPSSRQRVVEQKINHTQQEAPLSPLIRKSLSPADSGGLPPRIRNSLGMELMLIKPFTFENGQTQPHRFNMGSSDKPYWITLTQPYYLQTTQVTQGQWRVVMGQNPAKFQGDEWQPVERISWDDIAPFLQRLNMLNEGFYRLPTEAEWEYACRAGEDSSYSFGDNEEHLPEYAWFDANSQGRPHAVGMKKPNRWGLYDMHGNVWEWVADRFGAYPVGEFTNPRGPDRGNSRVMRGGSWNLGASYCRTDSRNYESASYQAFNLGVRVLLEAR